MIDAVGYFAKQTIYRHLVLFVYNKANRLLDSAFISALESLEPVAAVVVVPAAATV